MIENYNDRVSFARNWLVKQWQLFCLSLSFFSRIPIPASTPYSSEKMNRSGRYFALVGALIALLCCFAYTIFNAFLPVSVSVLLMMVFSLLLTGAFHEDGLTDLADGVGGGMTVERRLTIMKDSRIGTYGASALIMALLSKWLLLSEILISPLASFGFTLAVFVAAHTVSRSVAASLIYDMTYVSDIDASKSKPLANKQTRSELLFLIGCGVVSSLLLGFTTAFCIWVVAIVFRRVFKYWLIQRLGGFTGDSLGAAQQVMEILIYVVVLALMPVLHI